MNAASICFVTLLMAAPRDTLYYEHCLYRNTCRACPVVMAAHVYHVWGFKHCSAIKGDYFLFRGKWAYVTQTQTFHADGTPEKNICTFEMVLRRIMTDSCNAHGEEMFI